MKLKEYIKRGKKYIKEGAPVWNYITVEVKQVAPSEQLKNKNIIVTGGGRGLGFYIAKKCISEGANVVITGRNEEALVTAVQELGDNCQYYVFDSSNVSQMEEFFVEVSNLFKGKIDCLVSNAGISLHEGNFRNVTEKTWNQQIDVNLKGNYFLCKHFVEYLEKQENTKGNIVVITSERSQRPDDIPYGLTKVASNSFIKAMSSDVIGKNIRINGVGPGVTASDMTGKDKEGNLFGVKQPQKRLFVPEEVAEVVGFLLSDTSNCISGEIIICDQGRYTTTWH